MSVEDQAKSVVKALRRHPELLYAVVVALRAEEPVLGPWEGSTSAVDWRRYTAEGRRVARVSYNSGFWRWSIWGGATGSQMLASGAVEGDSFGATPAHRAMQDTDAWLVEHGYPLVKGEF